MPHLMFTESKRVSLLGNVWAGYRLNRHAKQSRKAALRNAIKVALIIENVHSRTESSVAALPLTPAEEIANLERLASQHQAAASMALEKAASIKRQLKQERIARQRPIAETQPPSEKPTEPEKPAYGTQLEQRLYKSDFEPT